MTSNNQTHLSRSAQGFTDQDIENIVSKEILGKAYTNIDLSSNYITQRGAAILANELRCNKVSGITIRLSKFYFQF